MALNREEVKRMLDRVAEEHEKLRQIKKTYRCPLCGQTVEGRAYPLDDLEDRVDTHLREKHGFGEG